MSDFFGILFFALVAVGVVAGLRTLGAQRISTEEEFEERASGSVSLASAGFQAVNGILNPSADKGAKAVSEVKKGTYQKKKEEGKGQGTDNQE